VKQVVAIVKPYLVEKVLEGLKRAPLEAVSVREVKGFGRQKSYLDQYAGSEYSLAFLPKVEINLWVDDARVEEIIRKIVEVARTGRMGDGKIFVLPAAPCERVIDIASAETPVKVDGKGKEPNSTAKGSEPRKRSGKNTTGK
jgi:nitrogen regulatory protein PII